jgi:hypothetical protein
VKINNFLLALAGASFIACAANAETQYWSGVEYYYTPESINSLTGKIYSLENLWGGTPAPTNQLHFRHGGLGAAPFSDPVYWAVNDYTGIAPATPLTAKQISRSPNCCFSTFQVEAGSGYDTGQFGWVMSTAWVPLPENPDLQFVNMQGTYVWPSSQPIRPWITSSSRLGFEFSMKIPSAGISYGAKSYVTAQIAIHDGSGHYFWMQPVIYLNGFTAGAESTDAIGYDVGTGAAYINPVYQNVGRYTSKFDNPFTGQLGNLTTTSTWSEWKWYSLTISTQQLLNAINDLNAMGGNFSTNLSDYWVDFMGIQSEINRQATGQPHDPDGWIGVGIKQVYAYRMY